MERKLEYTNGEITIEWRPALCEHWENCTYLLPEVYKPEEKKWIKINNASTQELISQIECCPTGALSYRYNTKKQEEDGL